MIDPKLIDFLDSHRICVISSIQSDGSLHSAACHFASTVTGELIILTENTTRKVQNMLDGKSVNAAVTVGFSEEEWKTWQATGTARVALKLEKELSDIYERKFKTILNLKPDSIFIIFSSLWYRYTEFKSDPKVIIESQ